MAVLPTPNKISARFKHYTINAELYKGFINGVFGSYTMTYGYHMVTRLVHRIKF